MTLTKYQRGDLMEGWNDCPPMMLQNNSSSSLASKSRRRARPEAKSEDGKRSVSLPSSSSGDLESAGEQAGEHAEVDWDQALDQLFSITTTLSDTLHRQIKTKITNSIDSGNAGHTTFVGGIATRLQRGEDKSVLKQQIVDFMMSNDGVSSWASPLKKLVDSAVIN